MADTDDGLRNLANDWRGELRGKNLAGRVLADFTMIQGLRSQKCPWHRIAAAMGVNPDSLRKLFLWTEKKIEAGILEPPAATPSPTKQTPGREAISVGAAKGEPTKTGGFKRINIDQPLGDS